MSDVNNRQLLDAINRVADTQVAQNTRLSRLEHDVREIKARETQRDDRVADARKSASDIEVSQRDLEQAMIRRFAEAQAATDEKVEATRLEVAKVETHVAKVETNVGKVDDKIDTLAEATTDQTKTLGKLDRTRAATWVTAVALGGKMLDDMGVLKAIGLAVKTAFGLPLGARQGDTMDTQIEAWATAHPAVALFVAAALAILFVPKSDATLARLPAWLAAFFRTTTALGPDLKSAFDAWRSLKGGRR